MRYEEPQPIDREQAEAAFRSDDLQQVCDALVRAALNEPDIDWIQEWCLTLSGHTDPAIRGCAVLCFGHLARIHRQLDTARVIPVLEALRRDPDVGGRVEDALADIQIFVAH